MTFFEKIMMQTKFLIADKPATVKFLKGITSVELLEAATGHTLLIKKQISGKECDVICKQVDTFSIYTEKAQNIEVFDSLKKLEQVGIIYKIKPQINLDFLHYSQTLFVFSENNGNSAIEDVVMITPVDRYEIEMSLERLIDIGDNLVQNNLQIHEEESVTQIDEKSENIISEENEETELLINLINEKFNEKFDISEYEIPGVSPEKKKISLTKVYKKLNIEQGRLLGSWRVFVAEEIKDLMDVGIAQTAIKACKEKYTYQIMKFGRIVPNEKKKIYESELNRIKNDYISYLQGKDIKQVGDISVKIPFQLDKKISESIEDLREYLMRLKTTTQYKERIINLFLSDEYCNLLYLWESVELRKRNIELSKEQWKDTEFVWHVMRLFEEQHLDDDLLCLLKRYNDKVLLRN